MVKKRVLSCLVALSMMVASVMEYNIPVLADEIELQEEDIAQDIAVDGTDSELSEVNDIALNSTASDMSVSMTYTPAELNVYENDSSDDSVWKSQVIHVPATGVYRISAESDMAVNKQVLIGTNTLNTDVYFPVEKGYVSMTPSTTTASVLPDNNFYLCSLYNIFMKDCMASLGTSSPFTGTESCANTYFEFVYLVKGTYTVGMDPFRTVEHLSNGVDSNAYSGDDVTFSLNFNRVDADHIFHSFEKSMSDNSNTSSKSKAHKLSLDSTCYDILSPTLQNRTNIFTYANSCSWYEIDTTSCYGTVSVNVSMFYKGIADALGYLDAASSDERQEFCNQMYVWGGHSNADIIIYDENGEIVLGGDQTQMKYTFEDLQAPLVNHECDNLLDAWEIGKTITLSPGKKYYLYTGYENSVDGNSSVNLYIPYSISVTDNTTYVSSVSLASSIEVDKGDSEQLDVLVSPSNASNKNVTWKSNNTSIATVSSTGVVTGVNKGTTFVTVETVDGKKTATCTVKVNEPSVPVTNIALNRSSLSLVIGDTGSVNVTSIFPSNATNKNVTYRSTNTSVATVNSSGTVVALAEGRTSIVVEPVLGNCSATCQVTVTPVNVSSVTLNKTEAAMTVGDTITLTPTVLPATATDKTVTWRSSRTSVATVTNNGAVTAVGVGEAIITCTTNNNNMTATCTVTVTADDPGSGVLPINQQVSGAGAAVYSLNIDKSSIYRFSASYAETNSYNMIVEVYDKYNERIMYWGFRGEDVSKDYALLKGSYVVKVSALAGTLHDYLLGVTPVNLSENYQSFEEEYGSSTGRNDVRSDADTITTGNSYHGILGRNNTDDWYKLTLSAGQSVRIKYKGSNYQKATQYMSMYVYRDEGTNTVVSKGIGKTFEEFSLNEPGDYYINVHCTYESGCSGSYEFSIIDGSAPTVAVTSVTLDKGSFTVNVGGTETLTPTVIPSNATDKSVTWSSSNRSVATVSDGVVTGVAAGTADITVSTVDGNKQAVCHVTVLSSGPVVTNVELTVGSTHTVDTAGATGLLWTSNNTAVATVTSRGVITGVKAGSTVVSAKDASDNTRFIVNVTVQDTVIPVVGVTLNPRSLDMQVGETAMLQASILPSNATEQGVTWMSDNPSVATVSDGVVIALKQGTATITVKTVDGDKTASCFVTVNAQKVTYYVSYYGNGSTSGSSWVKGFTKDGSIAIDKNRFLKTGYVFTGWNTKQDGTGRGYAPGEVYRTNADLELYAQWTEQVAPSVAVKGVVLNTNSATLEVGELEQLKYTIRPFDATNQVVSFTSRNSAVASVDDSGVIVAKAAGATEVYVTTNDGGFTDVCTVTVTKKPEVRVTGIRSLFDTVNIRVGEVKDLSVTTIPANADDSTIIYGSNKESVASVANGKVTGVSAGTADITCATVDGNYQVRVRVIVEETRKTEIPSLQLNKKTMDLRTGGSSSLRAIVYPAGTSYSWATSNPAVVTFDKRDGTDLVVITAQGEGTAVVTATTSDGLYSDSCEIRVKGSSRGKVYNIKYNLGIAKKANNAYNFTTYTSGDVVILKDPVQEGLDFEGWYLDSKFNNSTSGIDSDDTGNKTFYAKWQKIPYEIVYDFNGGNTVRNKTVYDVTTSTFSLKNPKKAGSTFVGWYDQDGKKVTKIVKGTTGDKQLKAIYKPVTYKIAYKLNGGKAENLPTSYIPDENTVIPTPIKAGCNFEGWKMGKEIVDYIPVGSTGKKTLTAVWSTIPYTIIYDLQGGTDPRNKTTYTVTTSTFSLKNPKKEGYAFQGWYDEDGHRVTKIVKGTTGNKVLVAKWRYK